MEEHNEMENVEPTLLEFGQVPTTETRPSSSKRKRTVSRDVYAGYVNSEAKHNNNNNKHGKQQASKQDSHTPKRSRQTDWPIAERDESGDGLDPRQRSVRRKGGKYGLSSINRRHAREHDNGQEKVALDRLFDMPSDKANDKSNDKRHDIDINTTTDHSHSFDVDKASQSSHNIDMHKDFDNSHDIHIDNVHDQTHDKAINKIHDRAIDKVASRFVEGSMNDKPSVNPPSMFTRDISNQSLAVSSHSGINVDNLMDEYHANDIDDARPSIELQQSEQRTSQHLSQHMPQHQPQHLHLQYHQSQLPPRFASPTRPPPMHELFSPPKPPSEYLSNQSPETKSSGLYRFGHMVAKSFNPVNMWGSFSRTFRDTKDEMTVRNVEENRRRVEEMRQKAQLKAEAEARYAELKAAGIFAKPVYTVVRRDAPPVVVHHEEYEEEEAPHLHEEGSREEVPRDSAMADRHLSKDYDDGASTSASIQRPRQSESTGPGSPAMPVIPLRPKKSFFGSIRKPSFPSLKKTRSDYSLLAMAGQSSTSLEPQTVMANTGHTLPRSQSKRELNKQHKLSKRVSDLELKLAEARRELTYAINTASPLPEFPTRFEKFTPGKHTPTITSKFKSKFIPGKLQSLPSERLLFTEQQPRASLESHGTIMEVFTPAARTNSIATQPPLDPEATEFPVPMSESIYMSGKPLPEPPMLDEEPTPSAQPTLKMTNYDDLDVRLKALDDHVEGRIKKKGGNKKRKSDFDDKDYRPTEDIDEDDFDAPKKSKKRKSVSKSDSRRTSTDTTPVTKTTMANDDDVYNDSPSQPANDLEVTTTAEMNRASSHLSLHSDPLDPIYEEGSLGSRHNHGLGLSQARADANNRVAEVENVEEEIIRIKPGVGDVPNLPNVSVRSRKKKTPKPSIQNFQWPDDVF